MVKTEDTLTITERWKEVFDRGRVIPPCRHTSRLAGENQLSESRGFELSLSRVTVPHLPQEAPEGVQVSYQLRVSLLDSRQQHFFGQTWRSCAQRLKNGKISFNQVLYFHTVLRIPEVLLVLELVELSVRADSSHQARGRGFTLLQLFNSTGAPAAAEGKHRLNLHHGSPRSLFHPTLRNTTDYSSVLRPVDSAHLDCSVRSHSALAPALHLLPENVLLCGDEGVPGLVVPSSGGALLKPHLLPSLALTLSSLSLSLVPCVESFERQLLQRVHEDCQHTKPGAEDTLRPVMIQERRLHVGVHNGWGFLERPQVVVLEVLSSTGSKEKDRAVSQKLALRSSLQLSLLHHPAVAIIFQLEYVFSAPIGKETMLSATASGRAAFLQSLRWGEWSPFHPSSELREGEIRLALQGGAKPNPHNVMVYRAHSDQESVEKDILSFHLSSSLDRRSPTSGTYVTAQEKTPRSKRKTSTPAHGRRLVQDASPPDSPPGPGLSLSQLAVLSRYPSITHFGSSSPWQPSSLLHPSPLATAHQVPHITSSIAHMEVDLAPDERPLQELPFTPVHAPVLSLGTSTPSSGVISSRCVLARLSSAGFPEVVDCTGQLAEALDPTEPMTFDPQREENDPLQGNLLLLQFLAFTRVPESGMVPDWPRSVYFTFQMYRFPPVTTQPLALLTDQLQPIAHLTDQSQSRTESLCLLVTMNRDGTTNSDSPGLELQFRVDRSFLKPGEQCRLLRYLALHSLQVDVWDSDSLLLLGSTAVPLKYMLRQGKAAVQALHQLDVLTTDYVGEEPLGASGDQGPDWPLTVHTVLRGQLHVRTANIGCPVHPDHQRAVDSVPSHIIIPREVTSGFRGGRLSPRNVLQLNARNSAQAQRLQTERPIRADLLRPQQTQDVRRKLSFMAAVHRREGSQNTHMPQVTETSPVPSPGVEQIKESITHMLSQAITTEYQLFCSLGSVEYLEYMLMNPFTIAHTVTISSDHPELSVITSAAEWRYFKSLHHTPSPVEENMFHLQPGAPGPQVYLRPKESLYIPLKYQSFQCDHGSIPHGPSVLPAGSGPQPAQRNPHHMASYRTIKVTFSTEDGKPLSILQVNVQPTPHVVDQTFRLYHPEQSFLKKAVRLPPWDQHAGGELGEGTQVTVRCSDPDVVCQTRKTVPGEPQDVYLKVPGSPSPLVRMFFVMVYTDKWMAAPSQVWQVYVHFLERVDMSVVSGQKSCQSLVLRGKQTVRKLRCYCSHPQDLQLEPAGVFVLPPASVQEVQVKVQLWRAGRRFFFLSAVDVEQRRLVSTWLLCLQVHQPVISKAFEVSVPVGEGRGSSRKITYTNPYNGPRTLLLRSDHPHLLQFREERFQV
ncbi:nephrocystin-4-like [Periophthalmus magnuspinnatus]|uniref:nephrocystin-4-like n=1 Tax=Periophthalmus magnuspinnatus TaxID=409849 RepID=UPI002436F0A6|nr:nephrocystin-4-like [Periophthalmus magnuspinnatus]